jgi:hypothetical protein
VSSGTRQPLKWWKVDYTNGLQHQGRVGGEAPAVVLVANLYDPGKQS